MRHLTNVKQVIADRLSLHEDYQAVFSGPRGERVLRHILKSGHVTSSTLVPNDPLSTSHNEGRRNLALSILRFVRRDHTELMAEVERTIENENP